MKFDEIVNELLEIDTTVQKLINGYIVQLGEIKEQYQNGESVFEQTLTSAIIDQAGYVNRLLVRRGDLIEQLRKVEE